MGRLTPQELFIMDTTVGRAECFGRQWASRIKVKVIFWSKKINHLKCSLGVVFTGVGKVDLGCTKKKKTTFTTTKESAKIQTGMMKSRVLETVHNSVSLISLNPVESNFLFLSFFLPSFFFSILSLFPSLPSSLLPLFPSLFLFFLYLLCARYVLDSSHTRWLRTVKYQRYF